MALVMLAAGRWPAELGDREESDLGRRGWVTITSKYSLDQTARQLQRAARAQGLPVVADVASGASAAASAKGGHRDGAGRVLVLGRADGHTPVMQASDVSPPDLPLRLLLRAQPDGSTRVMFSDPSLLAGQASLPDDVMNDIAALPKVVSAALRVTPDGPAQG
ncbi:MAG: hypothetical protein EOP40_07970 [Rubrivivax sp.]|nr:MAG: hypothetical protein EOP40_07970 [Rubrivivax sp.]